jgi:hypothetical protein
MRLMERKEERGEEVGKERNSERGRGGEGDGEKWGVFCWRRCSVLPESDQSIEDNLSARAGRGERTTIGGWDYISAR